MSTSVLLCLAHYCSEAHQKRTHHEDKQMKRWLTVFLFSLNLGCWHVLNLLLMDFVAHIFLSYIEEEEEEDENFQITNQNQTPVLWVYEPRHIWHYFAEEYSQANTPQRAVISLMQSQSNFGSSNTFPEF